jgi:hypothetical protein
MVKLCDRDSEVKNKFMFWSVVEESVWLDGGHGSLPLPDTSIATWRLSTSVSGELVKYGG